MRQTLNNAQKQDISPPVHFSEVYNNLLIPCSASSAFQAGLTRSLYKLHHTQHGETAISLAVPASQSHSQEMHARDHPDNTNCKAFEHNKTKGIQTDFPFQNRQCFAAAPSDPCRPT